MVCATCVKRDRVDVRTSEVLRLKSALDGGMPAARHEIPGAVWECLGRLRKRDMAEIGAMSAMRGMIG